MSSPRWWKTPFYAYLGIRAMLADAGLVRWSGDPQPRRGRADTAEHAPALED